MKRIFSVICCLFLFAFILAVGGTNFQQFSKRIDAKDPTQVLAPTIEKVVDATKPVIDEVVANLGMSFEFSNDEEIKKVNTDIVKIGKLDVPRLTLPKFTQEEIVKNEYVLKVAIKEEDKAFYQKLFNESKADEQVFLYGAKEKPTVTYVKLNTTSITRQYGNQQSFSSNPYGWTKDNKAEVIISHPEKGDYKGNFWNRSHLVADQLGGASKPINAITGTRTQNVGARDNKGGMRVPEERAYNYIKEMNKELLYFVDVVYYDDSYNIPNEVRVTLFNDEIKEQYVTYNVANGYNIDYVNATYVKK